MVAGMSTELCEPHRQYMCRECWIASQPPYVKRGSDMGIPIMGREVTLVGLSWWGFGTIRVKL